MKKFIILYRDEKIMAPSDPPFSFSCWADNLDHAEEQCLDAYPEVDIVWAEQTGNVEEAYIRYWAKE